ncbi:hypothetical protein P280DRAFT_472413 [Massarina eburnea CBS 473.64]|uniref:Uncharacterized protein n=1 Tax=Massarina eburnea CBS 473.64 TaxID=1395130 RepID=A0A6A6RPE5_9PLEO|nr:hypothetical protein P280DRAFT_472413 [Massarina eburnea CBS 473.64]
MPPPSIVSSFLSVTPLEPVLVFQRADDAAYFQSHCKQGRIMLDQSSRWVFLPMPEGLLRVRTARCGDVAYDFDTHKHARMFNESIKGLGTIFQSTKEGPGWDRTVYLGKILR